MSAVVPELFEYSVILQEKKCFPIKSETWNDIIYPAKEVIKFMYDFRNALTTETKTKLILETREGKNGQDLYYIIRLGIASFRNLKNNQLTPLQYYSLYHEKAPSKKRKQLHVFTLFDIQRMIYHDLYDFDPKIIEKTSKDHETLFSIKYILDSLKIHLSKSKDKRILADKYDSLFALPIANRETLIEPPNRWISTIKGDLGSSHVIESIKTKIASMVKGDDNKSVEIFKEFVSKQLPQLSGMYPKAIVGLQRYALANNDKFSFEHRKFDEWIQYLYGGITKIFCYNCEDVPYVMFLYDSLLSQFSTESPALKYLQIYNVNRSSIETFATHLQKISIPGTFMYLDRIASTHVSDISQAFQFWYDTANTSNEGRSSVLKEQILQGSMITIKVPETDSFGKKRVVLKTSQLSNSLLRFSMTGSKMLSNHVLTSIPLRTMQNTDEEEIKLRRHLVSKFSSANEKKFIDSMQRTTFLVAISNLYISCGLYQPPEKLWARLVINQLIESLRNYPIMINITTEDIDRILVSMSNKAIAISWMAELEDEISIDRLYDLLPKICKNSIITLDIIIWCFCQYFSLFKDFKVETILSTLYTQYINVPALVSSSRAFFLGSRFKDLNKTSLRSPFDMIMAYYAFEYDTSIRSVAQFNKHLIDDIPFVDFNYVVMNFRSNQMLSSTIYSLMKDRMKFIGVDDVKNFFENASPLVYASNILPFIPKNRIDAIIDLLKLRRAETIEMLKKLNSDVEPHEVEKILRERYPPIYELLTKYMIDGDPFHSHSPIYFYDKSIGIPLFTISKIKGGIALAILTQCFDNSYSNLLIESIRSMKNLTKRGEETAITAIIDNKMEKIALYNETYEEQYLEIPKGTKFQLPNSENTSEMRLDENKIYIGNNGFDFFVKSNPL